MVQLLEEFACKILKDDYYVTGRAEILQAGRLLNREFVRVTVNNYSNVFSIPKRYPLV